MTDSAPDLVIEATLEQPETPTLVVPTVNSVSLKRVDAAVDEIERHAQGYVCTSPAEYEFGALQIARIRKLTPLYEQVFKPLKDWWQARKDEAATEEKSRTDRLNTSKATYWASMQTWKAAEDKKAAELKAAQEALERKRAEDARLAQAEEITARAKATGNQKLAEAAIQILDKPLDIAPVVVRSTVPKLSGSGVKAVKRKVVVGKFAYELAKRVAEREHRLMTDQEWKDAQVIKGRDLEELLICVGVSLLLNRGTFDGAPALPPDVYKALQPYASPSGQAIAVKELNAAWIKAEFASRGDTFKLGGVEVVLREGLG